MSQMSFREKSAWISFVVIALVFGVYFARILRVLPRALGGGGDSIHFFFVLGAALILFEVGLHLAIKIQSPQEARTPKDERDRLIDMKATRLAFPVLLVGTFAAIFTLHLAVSRGVIINVMLAAVVVAQLTRFGAQIVYHRRGF
jgi:hypothetical protein